MELISAIATAPGVGGVGIVRVSGEGALDLATRMFSKKDGIVPNMMVAGKIEAEELTDFGFLVYFRAPHSFTGEDTVEFHCHGGKEIVRSVFFKTLSLGARAANAGEFTRRAFLNGKLSLSACEGLGEMIKARSAMEARAGYSLYAEMLTKEGREMQGEIKSCLAALDADADFPEEDLFLDACLETKTRVQAILPRIGALLGRFRAGKKIKSGVKVVLLGKPNAGKSALFNALLGCDRAIVSPSAGTTRDALEGEIELFGVRFCLFDTAGLRSGGSKIEREGIRRAENLMKEADLLLYLKEDGDGVELPGDVPVITIGAKCDVKRQKGCELYISSKTGEGLGELKNLLYERGFGGESDGVFLLEERHFEALKEAQGALERALAGAEEGREAELLAEDLKAAYTALGTISGETASEDVIEEIFSKFCVGK